MFCTFQCITIYTFQRVAPTTPPILLRLAPSHKILRFELNTLNLALGGISILHKIKYLIAYGAVPQDPPLQISTTVINPFQKILDPSL